MRKNIRYATTVVLAVGGLLALGACGLHSAPSSVAVPTPAAAATATATPFSVPTTAAEPPPVVEKRIVTETRRIPFTTRKVKDSTLAKGTTKVRTRGRAGVMTLTYEVTLTDGVRTDKRLVDRVVTTKSATRIIAVGTRKTRQCDPNYSGACVPVASDVDCAGNSGNGPAYVSGPVRVVGVDIYDLDRDGDGIACD